MNNPTPRRSAVQSPDDIDPERTAAMEPVTPPPPPGQDRGESDEEIPGGQPAVEPTPGASPGHAPRVQHPDESRMRTGDGRDGGSPDDRQARGGGGQQGAAANLRSLFGPRRGNTSVAEREAALSGTVPVASFPSYGGAANAVARLAGAGFPIEQITIVGGDLRLIEEVTGRMNIPRAAGMGAVSGAWFGALVAALVGIFAGSFGTFLALLLWGIVLGAVFGAGLGILGYIAFDRSRGFTSDRLVVAAHYDLHTSPDTADRLRAELLAYRSSDVRIIDGAFPANAAPTNAPVPQAS